MFRQWKLAVNSPVSSWLIFNIYIYIYIYIYIRRHVFRPPFQDSSVRLGSTSREQLISPECSKQGTELCQIACGELAYPHIALPRTHQCGSGHRAENNIYIYNMYIYMEAIKKLCAINLWNFLCSTFHNKMKRCKTCYQWPYWLLQFKQTH